MYSAEVSEVVDPRSWSLMPNNAEGLDHPSQENGSVCWMSEFLHNPGDPRSAKHRPQLWMDLLKATGCDANFTCMNHEYLPIIF